MPLSSSFLFRRPLYTVIFLLIGLRRRVDSLPAGFQEEGVARVVGLSTITFVPQFGKTDEFFIFAAAKKGVVHRLEVSGSPNQESTIVLDIEDQVCENGERGLHQVISHPAFATDSNKRFVYISYTFDKFGGCRLDNDNGAVNRLSRFQVNNDYSIRKSSEEVFLETRPLTNSIHNGGDILFGNDGYLYFSIGDGGDSANAQDTTDLRGTIVRLTEDGDVPPDNPFQGTGVRCNGGSRSGLTCSEIYHYGFRNPYRISKDPNINDETKLIIADVGGRTWEEINFGGTGFAGRNFGWQEREGPCIRSSYTDCPEVGNEFVDPFFWYAHDGEGAAVTGIAAVPSGVWPAEYDDTILYLDFVRSELYVTRRDGISCRDCDNGRPQSEWESSLFHDLDDSNVGRAAQLVFGPYNDKPALYYTTRQGDLNIRRISFEGTLNRAPTALISVDKEAGLVGTEFKFDGSGSSDPDGDSLTYVWDLGNGRTSAGVQVSVTFDAPGNHDVSLLVTDPSGFTGSTSVVVDVGSPPLPTIESPSLGTTFAVGDILVLRGSAVDSGGLDMDPGSSLSWEVRQHHNTHFHPFLDPNTIGNDITIDPAPSPEDLLAATNSYLEILLTVTDSEGFSATTSRQVMPKMSTLSVSSVPPGMEVLLDGYAVTTPVSVPSWVNHPLLVEAVDQGDNFFQEWNDGQRTATRTLTITDQDQSLSANFSTCRPLWSTSCAVNSDCCSGQCRNSVCRASRKEAKLKLAVGRGGAAQQARQNGETRLRRSRIRG